MSTSNSPSGAGSRGLRVAVFLAFTAAYFLSYFFRSTNAVIAPSLQRDIALGADQLGFMTAAYFLAFAAVQIPLGMALDRWGARWVTASGLLVAALGGLVFAGAESYQVLIVGRLLIGAGMGSVLMGAMKSFSRHFQGGSYRTATSALVGIGSLGAVAAASPLALMTQSLGWRNAFVVAAACVAITAVLIALVEAPRGRPQAAATEGGGEEAGAYRVFRDARLWALAVLNLFMSGILFSVQGLWAGPLLFDTAGFTEVEAGQYLTVLSIGAALGFGFAGTIANRLGVRRALIAATLALQAAIWGMLFLPPPALLIAFFVFGMSGAFNILLLAQARFVAPMSHVGRATTFVNLVGIGGGFVLQWGIGVVLTLFEPAAGGAYPRLAYAVALGLTAVGLLAASIAYAAVSGRRAAPGAEA